MKTIIDAKLTACPYFKSTAQIIEARQNVNFDFKFEILYAKHVSQSAQKSILNL